MGMLLARLLARSLSVQPDPFPSALLPELHARIVPLALAAAPQDMPRLARVCKLYARLVATEYGPIVREQMSMRTEWDNYIDPWSAVDIDHFLPLMVDAGGLARVVYHSHLPVSITTRENDGTRVRVINTRVGRMHIQWHSTGSADAPDDVVYTPYLLSGQDLLITPSVNSAEPISTTIRVISAVFSELNCRFIPRPYYIH